MVLVNAMEGHTHFDDQFSNFKIGVDIINCNNSYKPKLATLYSAIFAENWSPFTKAFNSRPRNAKNLYINALMDSVSIHDLWYASGTWKSPGRKCQCFVFIYE